MSERVGFVIYDQQIEALMKMPGEQCKTALAAMRDYALTGKVFDGDDLVVQIFFELVKPQIDANNKRYENGKKGGRPKTVPVPDYIAEQENGTLPKQRKASKSQIAKVRKEQEKYK